MESDAADEDASPTASGEERADGDEMDVEIVGEERVGKGPFSAHANRFPVWLKTRTTRRLRLGVRRARRRATRSHFQKRTVNPASRPQPKRLLRVVA